METPDELYITIVSEDLPFLLPVTWIANIKGNDGQRGAIPMIDLARLVGPDGEKSKSPYLLSLSHEGKAFDLAVQKVCGLCTVPKRIRIKLPDCVRNGDNRYLSEAAPLERGDGSEQELAYILSPEVLFQMAADDWAASGKTPEE